MEWKITYFSDNVYDDLMEWPQKILAKYIRITSIMEKEGPDLGMPFTRSLGDGLFEIRAKAQEGIGRAFFCALIRKRDNNITQFYKKDI